MVIVGRRQGGTKVGAALLVDVVLLDEAFSRGTSPTERSGMPSVGFVGSWEWGDGALLLLALALTGVPERGDGSVDMMAQDRELPCFNR